MERRIIILSDNRTDTPLLGTEHGLSAYMEYGGRRYLLDTGASDLFMLNAEKLGVDLGEVDYCLISHGHNDHIGGLSAFLEMNHKAKVILSSEIPGAEYASVRRYLHSITGMWIFRNIEIGLFSSKRILMWMVFISMLIWLIIMHNLWAIERC